MANLARIGRLIHVLEALPEADPHFDIRSYANHSNSCGTTACAVGYGSLDPELMGQGLRLCMVSFDREPKVFINSMQDFEKSRPHAFTVAYVSPSGVCFFESDGVTRFFDIDHEEFVAHFMPGGYGPLGTPVGPHDVAKKLRTTFGITT